MKNRRIEVSVGKTIQVASNEGYDFVKLNLTVGGEIEDNLDLDEEIASLYLDTKENLKGMIEDALQDI